MKISVESLCARAGLSRQAYENALHGRSTPTPSTLARLNRALARFKLSYGGEAGPMTVHATYRATLALAAGYLKEDAKAALSFDPARRSTSNPDWMAASRVRWLAFWICNGQLGLRQSDIARAAGVVKQAVCDGIREIEDDEALTRLRDHIDEVFS